MLRLKCLAVCAAVALGCSGAIAGGAPTITPAPAKPSTEQLIGAHMLAITRTPDGQFAGAGWDRLVSDARAAQFTLIGEQHAVADLADFETQVFRAIAPFGYSHAALEVGPFSTTYAERLIRSGRGALPAFIASPNNSFTLPFLFFAEEAAMAEEIVARSPDRQQALWGIDQEFVGAMPILARLLGERAANSRERAQAAKLAARANADAMVLPALTTLELDELAAAFVDNAAAGPIVEAIRTSHAIYRPFMKGGAVQPANLRRETYMKDNFLRQFEATERRLGHPPKVFLKFGGYHAMRGMSGTDVPALGNFLAEWGHSRGFGLLNVMADCVSGRVVDPRSGQTAPCEPYIGTASVLHRIAADNDQPIMLVDLKALRANLRAMPDLDPTTRQTILAFDYYIAFKEVRPSTPLAPLTKG